MFDIKKDSIFPLVSKFFTATRRTSDDFVVRWQTAAVHLAVYEDILAVWKEKVRNDMVRPPSIIRTKLGNKMTLAHGGPNAGIRLLPFEEWEAYIRTMPHVEFPSAPAYLCKAFQDSMTANSGGDDFGHMVNGTLDITLVKGASKIEKGFPMEDITLQFRRWSKVSRVCGMLRLNGGMHFTMSLKAGDELCASIGNRAVEFMRRLFSGKRPKYVAPFGGMAR